MTAECGLIATCSYVMCSVTSYVCIQIAVCLSKAPLLLRENLEDKLLPLCDYLNSIGLDLDKQRRIVTWWAYIFHWHSHLFAAGPHAMFLTI